MQEILKEVYRTTKKVSGIDPSKPGNMRQILVDDAAFDCYVNGLAESIENEADRKVFLQLAENTRVNLLENSMFQINPYESLTLPILRVFYPKLVAKEAVTVSPMDKPESVKPFITASFDTNSGGPFDAPSTNNDVSGGPSTVTAVNITIPTDGSSIDILAEMSLTSTQAHLERDFVITAVEDVSSEEIATNIVPAVEGHFSEAVTFTNGTSVVSGKVDYLNGTLQVSANDGGTAVATKIKFSVSVTLEENRVNPTVRLNVDKVRLYAKDRQISSNWSINMEQDMRALFDVSMQAEIVNILGQQIALDIDREIVDALIAGNGLNPSSHEDTFDRTPPGAYAWGPKYWHENIVEKLNRLSAQVYTSSNIEAANTILANPLDVSILEDIQTFNYTGTSVTNGDLGYRSATVAGGKWKVLTTAVVPQGAMVLVFKPVEELKCTFLHCPYVPAVLHPYPLGYTPSLTILSRYANSLVRASGIAKCNIIET